MNTLAERLIEDMQAQYEAGQEAARYYPHKNMLQAQLYWEGWNERGRAMRYTIKKNLLPSDLSEAANAEIADLQQQVKALNKELKNEQGKTAGMRKQRDKARKDAKKEKLEAEYQKVKRLVVAGGRVIKYYGEGNSRPLYKIKNGINWARISQATIDRLNSSSVQFDLWSSAKTKKAA